MHVTHETIPADPDRRGPGIGLPTKVILAAALVSVWLMTGFFKVGSHERAVVLVWGRAVAFPEGGLHWHWPWPIGRATVVEPESLRSVQVGVSQLATLTGRRPGDARTQYMAADQGLIQILVRAQYTIRNEPDGLKAFQLDVTPLVAERLVAAAIESAVTREISRHAATDLLRNAERKSGAFVRVRDQAQQRLNEYGAGVVLKAVSLVALQAPDPVVGAFNDVLSAQSESNTRVRQAESEAAQLVQAARARATEIRLEAQANANRLVELARARLDEFPARAEAFRAARQVSAKRLFLETMRAVLPRVRKVIVPTGPDGNSVDVSIMEPSR